MVAELKPPFCKKRPLLVDFKVQTRAQKTPTQRPRVLGPRLPLKTHEKGSLFAERGFQPAWANIAYEVYAAILGIRNASETVE